MRVHITGWRPMAIEMARTRSLVAVSGVERTEKKPSLLNVTKWRPHHVWRDPERVLDDLFAPSKLGNDLLVGERRERGMTPCVNGDLVARDIFCLCRGGKRDDARPDDEECRLEALLVKILHQIRRVVRRSVIIRQSPVILKGAFGNIVWSCAASAGPPTTGWISRSGQICRATALNKNKSKFISAKSRNSLPATVAVKSGIWTPVSRTS